MQASPNPDDERDLRTMVVADHGVILPRAPT